MNNLLNLFRGTASQSMPVWLMRQAGRYLPEYRELRKKAPNFMEFCYSPDLAAEATLQPIRRYDLDAAIIFSDILVIPDALGQGVSFKEGPVLSPFDLNHLEYQPEKLTPVYEAIRRVRSDLPSSKALFGFAGAPWTLASYMIGQGRDIDKAKKFAQHDRKSFDRLMDILIQSIADHLKCQIQAGADILQIFDSWAGQLAYQDLLSFSKTPIQKIISLVKESHPQIPIIVFPREIGSAYKEYLDIGADALSLDYALPLDWAKNHLQQKILLQGNLHPKILVEGGARLKQHCQMIKQTFGSRHIFNLGHGILPQTPPEHVEQMIKWVKSV